VNTDSRVVLLDGNADSLGLLRNDPGPRSSLEAGRSEKKKKRQTHSERSSSNFCVEFASVWW